MLSIHSYLYTNSFSTVGSIKSYEDLFLTKLQLADASGISMLPNTEIFEGMGNMGYPADEDEDAEISSKQGRNLQEEEGKTLREEDISPRTLEAAKTLSKVASQRSKLVDKGKRYKRRKESKGKTLILDLKILVLALKILVLALKKLILVA
ncbi:hypothetical protein Tco_1495532 [Tanacetum coccineum]